MVHGSHTKNCIPIHLGQVLIRIKKLLLVKFSTTFFLFSFGNKASEMSEKFRLDRKIGFRNTFYTKCINVIIDSVGPLIILRSIYQNNLIAFYIHP